MHPVTRLQRNIPHVLLWHAALDRMALNIMGANAIQNVGVAIDGKGQAVAAADTGFPDVPALRITLTFHLPCPQRGMPKVAQKKIKRPVSTVLQALRKPFVIAR